MRGNARLALRATASVSLQRPLLRRPPGNTCATSALCSPVRTHLAGGARSSEPRRRAQPTADHRAPRRDLPTWLGALPRD
eukprot:11917366-Alexandrium_andersonii.AAC.1